MEKKKYFRGSFKSIRVEEDTEGNKSLIFKTAHSGQTADYSDPNNLMDIAFNARKNANDLYNLVTQTLRGHNPVDIPGYEMLVALVNLSSELYMKSLIYFYKLNQGKQCKGLHNLEDYFLKLPNDIQLELKTIDSDFEMQLKTISNYFNEFRYSFEFNWISSKEFPFSFAEKLNQLCNAIKIKRPAEFVYSNNNLLIKHGEKTIMDFSKMDEYQYPIISRDD